MGDLTKNFSLYEFRQRNPYLPVPPEYHDNVQRLAEQLQALRDVVGPITITSGWRSRAKNTKIGGATNSQHLTAKAADFTVPGVSNKNVYCAILRLIPLKNAWAMEEGGLGWYGEKTANRTPHIHYDVRGFKRRWNETDGPLPVCPEIPPEEEDEEVTVMLKDKDTGKGVVTNFVTKAPIRNRQHQKYLTASGVKGPFPVDGAFIAMIQDADAVRGTIS